MEPSVTGKLGTITAALTRQNRWLILLLVAWPWAFMALLLLPGNTLTQDDIRALLQQEYFYGVALTMVLAASLFGAELRARRVAGILCHAVSRNQYLAALWLTALLPAFLFALSVFFSVWLAAGKLGFRPQLLAPFILNLLVVEFWMVVCGVFYSLFLPALLASLSVGVTVTLLVSIGSLLRGPAHSMQAALGLGPLLLSVFDETGGNPHPLSLGIEVASVLAQAILLCFFSQQIFQRKDLRSAGE